MQPIKAMNVSEAGGRHLLRRLLSLPLRAVSIATGITIQVLILTKSIIDYLKLRYIDFRPRPDDIFIATYPRSGTTWMQMILYQMTSEGEMNFQHISEVCPWFERSIVTGRDLELLPSPRVFKTHLRPYLLPRQPVRHLYVARNGEDVAVSLYHFYRSHFGYKGTFPEFFEMFLRGKVEGGSWFIHVGEWWKRRNAPNVLFLTYEDLVRDLEGSIRRIGAFCGIEIPPERMPRILERSAFAFMKKHEAQFDHTNEVLWEQGVEPSSFLRKGQAGEGLKQLSPDQQQRFHAIAARKLASIPPSVPIGRTSASASSAKSSPAT